MAKKQIRDYVFTPGIAGVGTLKLLDKWDSDQILLITNTTTNTILYNFSDANTPISVDYIPTLDGEDIHFPYANSRSNGITLITFLYDISSSSHTDKIQIFVESDEQTIRPYDFGTDAIERMRMAAPQAMLDADFEYGIQPTKWQSIDLLRGYPSIYEVPGSDISLSAITTDASQGSGGIGPSLITVDTQLDHNLTVGKPVTVKGLNDSVSGFAKAEGSFIVNTVPSTRQFTYYAKAKVGSSPATSLLSSFSVLKEAGFYTGAEIGSNPTITVLSNGAAGSFATRGSTPQGSTRIGVSTSATLPPVGSPLSAVNVAAGTQVTGLVNTNATLNITNSFTAPVSTITFNDVTDIEIGSALDNGDGTSIFVTNIEGNVVTLSSPYTVSKTGNSFVSESIAASPQNFGQGSGASFDVTRANGAYSTVIINPQNFYNNVTGSYSGQGSGASFNIERIGGASPNYINVFTSSAGSGYSPSETIVIPGSSLGGVNTTNDLTITISTVDANGGILTFTKSGTASNTLTKSGNGYNVGEVLVIYGNSLGGTSPLNDLKIHITGVGVSGNITSFDVTGVGIPSNKLYSSVEASTTSGSGINSSFTVDRIGSGTSVAQVNQITIGGIIEAGDVFNATINGTATYTYTAQSGETITAVRNGLLNAINASTSVIATAGATSDKILVTSLTAGVGFTLSVQTEESGGGAADQQTITAVNLVPNQSSSSSPSYSVTIANPGSGFAANDTITIHGSILGGTNGVNDLTITVQSVNATGGITSISSSGTAWNGNATYINYTANPTAFNATFLPRITNGAYAVNIDNPGSGYQVGYEFKILGVQLGGTSPVNDMTIEVTSVDGEGKITEVTASGTPVTGDTIQFYKSVAINTPTTGVIGTTTNIAYSAIARIQVAFSSNHGLVPGDTIISAITSNGTNHNLASGPFFVDEVPSLTSIVYTVRSTGTVSTGLVGKIYPRTDSYYQHRPFDGGVQLGTGGPAYGAQAVRQSKKYIRYQSGKGIMYTTGALFAPSYDLRSVSATGTAIGSIITIVTDDTNHGLQVGAEIVLNGIRTSGYENNYIVASIVDETTFTVIAKSILGASVAEFDIQPTISLYQWKGATVRCGAFDDQNGIFFQYDGDNFAVGVRSSTFQLAGTITATPNSNTITGTNTKFQDQVSVGDRIVIRGMSHVVTKIDNNTRLFVNPDYRGVNTASNIKCALTKDYIIPQHQWNIDKADGYGKSGYQINITRMQMIGFQYSWYGAGFIDWMLRGPSGNFIFLHRLKNNNRNTEAFMRSGNLPVRYEVLNEGAKGRLDSAVSSSAVDELILEDANLFPDSGIVYIDNEIIRYTEKENNKLKSLTREATFSNFSAGSQRTYKAAAAALHTKGTGVVLLSCTATPQINHWGSAFLTDGGFDEDRGYLFSHQEKEITISTTKSALFLIRLSPSVSNALTGDLGDRELINRAQLLLKNIEITTQGGSSSQGVIVEGILNPRNYPIDPATVRWTGLNTGGSGGQPSFAQIAAGSEVTWEGTVSPVTATNALNQGLTNYVVFNRSAVAGVQIGWSVSGGAVPGGTTVVNFINYDATRIYVQLSNRTNPGSAGATSYTFAPIVTAAVPGEQVFTFTAAPGQRDSIDLTELKELTNTPIGGRGTFPNGPDVLAINAYVTSGSAIKATINIRWSEAQA